MRLISMFILALFAAFPLAVHADHESAATILGQWNRYAPRLHILKPAQGVRELPISQDQEVIQRVTANARPLLGHALSALLIENGAIAYEGYAQGASRETQLNSYSMAKSLTALAVGEALCAEKIKSLEDQASVYAPQLEGTAYGAASIRNLLRMTSGAEDPGGNGYAGIHNPRDFRAMTTHQMSLVELMRKYGGTSRFKPGEKFIYNGLDSDALSLVIRGATGMSLAAWFEATVWQQAGAESQAGWYLDREGHTVAEILFFATTRDFARVGLYISDRLTDKAGEACIRDFIKDAAKPQVQKGYWDAAPAWGLGLHTGADGNTWMFGHGGQRVGINVKTGRVLATNGYSDPRGVDTTVQGILAR